MNSKISDGREEIAPASNKRGKSSGPGDSAPKQSPPLNSTTTRAPKRPTNRNSTDNSAAKNAPENAKADENSVSKSNSQAPSESAHSSQQNRRVAPNPSVFDSNSKPGPRVVKTTSGQPRPPKPVRFSVFEECLISNVISATSKQEVPAKLDQLASLLKRPRAYVVDRLAKIAEYPPSLIPDFDELSKRYPEESKLYAFLFVGKKITLQSLNFPPEPDCPFFREGQQVLKSLNHHDFTTELLMRRDLIAMRESSPKRAVSSTASHLMTNDMVFEAQKRIKERNVHRNTHPKLAQLADYLTHCDAAAEGEPAQVKLILQAVMNLYGLQKEGLLDLL